MKIHLGGNDYTEIDTDDYALVMSSLAPRAYWGMDSGNRPRATIIYKGRKRSGALLYRLLLDVLDEPEKFVDHIDGNPLNNTRANLRIVNRQQSQMNRGMAYSNEVGYKGVCKAPNGRFRAFIYKDRCQKFLGYFNTAKEAACAYNAAAVELHGEYARINSFEE